MSRPRRSTPTIAPPQLAGPAVAVLFSAGPTPAEQEALGQPAGGNRLGSVLGLRTSPFNRIFLLDSGDRGRHARGWRQSEDRGWHSVRMRRWNEARAGYYDLLFVKWRDGFEEIYDYDPHLYDGRVGTPSEQQCSARGSPPCAPPRGTNTAR